MTRSLRIKVVALAVGGLGLVLSPLSAEARHRISKLFGGLTTEQVACDTLCTEGPLTGGLAGKLEFRMDSMEETDDPEVSRYVGVNTITTSSGTLKGKDYGLWNLTTGEFVDFMVFEQTTGAYAGKRGTLVIVGKFDPVAGVGASHYKAILY
jgi:hypothetical protein